MTIFNGEKRFQCVSFYFVKLSVLVTGVDQNSHNRSFLIMSPIHSNFFSYLHSVGILLYDSNLFLHFLPIPNIVDLNCLTLLNVTQSVLFSFCSCGSSDQSAFDHWLGLSSQRMFRKGESRWTLECSRLFALGWVCFLWILLHIRNQMTITKAEWNYKLWHCCFMKFRKSVLSGACMRMTCYTQTVENVSAASGVGKKSWVRMLTSLSLYWWEMNKVNHFLQK